MRYIQRINADGTSRFDLAGENKSHHSGAAIHGDIKSFVSPVDGSVITGRKQLRLHNERNNVVNSAEFEGIKQQVTGEHTPAQTYARKCELHEILNRAERNN
jgi:hypothetical protein